MIEVKESSIEGLRIIKPKVFCDDRGYFEETWNKINYNEIGIIENFVQDNCSLSKKGTLRGLHYQKNHPQGKIVYVTQGEVFDVVVDIRPKSRTFGKWYGIYLNDKNHLQLWIPKGFAHGFYVTTEVALLNYKCTDYYHPEDQYSIKWDDPSLKIEWPGVVNEISDKDKNAEYFEFEKFI